MTDNLLPVDNRTQIESNLFIRTKRGQMAPFKLNKAQQYYWERKTRRNLILKARQKGLSKIIDADQFVDCVNKSTNAVVISHEKNATTRLFAAVRYFVENAKVKPEVSIDSKQEMKFPKRGSSYFIGTAGQRAFGRGDTVDRAHLSEAAFYFDLLKILAGISEAAEYGQIDIETTPNGRDQFYDLWQKAKNGQSPYTCIFIPWFIDEEYSSDGMTDEEKAGLSTSVRELFATPDTEILANLQPDEKLLIEKAKREHNIDITPGQIKWRRYKIWDKGPLFFQEYPEDDESCFLQSGRSVFSLITCDPSKQIPLDNIEMWGNEELRKELKKRPLYGGVDCAEGTLTGDRHVFTVIDAPADSEVAHVIFEITSNEPIDVFWQKVKKITDNFTIFIGIEKNGVGVAHVRQAKALGIPRIKEWTTGPTNRPVMITDLEEYYRKGWLIESYREAENEARDMIYTNENRPEAAKGKHDDRPMSRAIALQIRKRPVPRVTML